MLISSKGIGVLQPAKLLVVSRSDIGMPIWCMDNGKILFPGNVTSVFDSDQGLGMMIAFSNSKMGHGCSGGILLYNFISIKTLRQQFNLFVQGSQYVCML